MELKPVVLSNGDVLILGPSTMLQRSGGVTLVHGVRRDSYLSVTDFPKDILAKALAPDVEAPAPDPEVAILKKKLGRMANLAMGLAMDPIAIGQQIDDILLSKEG